MRDGRAGQVCFSPSSRYATVRQRGPPISHPVPRHMKPSFIATTAAQGRCTPHAKLLSRSSREEALSELRAKLLQHKEVDAKVRQLRESVAAAKKEFDKTEDDLKALQSVGQIIGEVLRQLDAERCELTRLSMQSTSTHSAGILAQTFASSASAGP